MLGFKTAMSPRKRGSRCPCSAIPICAPTGAAGLSASAGAVAVVERGRHPPKLPASWSSTVVRTWRVDRAHGRPPRRWPRRSRSSCRRIGATQFLCASQGQRNPCRKGGNSALRHSPNLPRFERNFSVWQGGG